MIKKLLATVLALFAAVAFAAVDANKATQAELEAVKGIGPAISTKIIDERKKAPFKDWEDMVVRVKGVGDGNAAKFSADGLTVNGATFKGVAAAPAAAKKEPAAAPKAEEKKAATATTTAAAPAAAAAPMATADDKKAAAKKEKEDKAAAKKKEKEDKAAAAKKAKEDKAAAAQKAKDEKAAAKPAAAKASDAKPTK
jgi:competence protein ComEA